ncbi:MAG: hypothetical protein L6R48_21805, partial [Planctomycetes bacterium]|nr:hypothetical protein [Planctomycetota bacterium]
AAATLRLLPAAVPAPADPAPRRAAWVAELPVPPAPLQALALADQPGRAPWLPLTAGGQAFVAGGDGLLAFDLASGALRWRAAGGDGSVPAFAGAPEHRPALAAGVVAARVAVDGRWRLLAWRAGDGRPLWSSAGQAALAGLEAISSPAACGDALVVLASGRERVACLVLDAASGALRGQVELPGERRQPGVGAWGAGILGGHQPAPLIAGGTAYCDTGCGLVAAVAVDACRLRWLAAYPRTVVGEWARPGATALLRRGASTPVLAGGVLAVAPRDSLVVAAFDPVDGRPRWLLDLPDCRRLAAAGGDGLLLQGDALTCLDAASGGTRWRWSRPEAPLLGALAGPGAVLAATAEGLQSLALADGAPGEARAWRELGLDRPATQLVEAGGRLLAAGDGRLALLTGEAGGAARRIAVPAPSVAVQPRAAAVAGDGRGLAVAWFLPAGRIEDLAALPDGCLVRTGDAVLRIVGANGAVRWRTAIPPGSGAVLAAERVVVLDRGWFADLDPATGAVRSSGRLDSDPALVFADDVRCQMQVGDGWLSVSRWGWDQPVLLRRLDDGRTTRVTGMGAPVSAAVIDGRLRVLSSRQGGLWVGDFDPETGAAGKSTRVGNDGWFERWVGWPQRPRWRMAQRGGQVELFDLVAATRSVVAVEGLTGKQIHGLMTWLDGDRLGLFAQDGWASARVGILDPANPAACATRPLPRIEGGRNRLRLANRLLPFGDATVVACERDVPGKGWCSGVACFGPERERWFRPFAGEGRRRPQVMAVLPWGTRLGVVTREGDEGLRWHLLAADGTVQDSGLLPAGWFDGGPGVALALGDRWLLGTGEGLVALAPGSGGLAPVTVPVPAVADTAALAGLAPLAPAGDLPVQVRLGRSEDALLLLVSVPGADAGQGREGLDLGLLPLERNRRGDAAEPARWRVRLADGRTLVERSGPGEALAIRARACSTPAGMRYELSVPWAAIAGEEATRPGALALGLALTSAGRSAELGHGLRAGIAPHAWAVVDWGRK